MHKGLLRPTYIERCMDSLKKHVKFNYTKDLVVDPNAGRGTFIEHIKKLCENYIFVDPYPEHKQVVKMNYLDFPSENLKSKSKSLRRRNSENTFRKIHVIGIPPADLTTRFIRKSCEFCDTVAFILPKSYREFKNVFPSNFQMIYEKVFNVHRVFQIWIKKRYTRA
jgi:hypothetical protein